jgi:hypothetical protein
MAQLKEQFGNGIVTPFQRDGKGDFAHGSGMRLLKDDIGELIGIEGPTPSKPGELPWDPDRGSAIRSLRHRRMHLEMTRALAEQYTARVVRQYEKRVLVGPARVVYDGKNKLRVDFSFTPKGVQNGELETVPIYPEDLQ